MGNSIIGLLHTLDLHIGHSTCFRDIGFLAKEVYFLSKIQENLTSVEQLKEMSHSNSYSIVMSKLMRYAKNVTGSDAYWHKVKG